MNKSECFPADYAQDDAEAEITDVVEGIGRLAYFLGYCSADLVGDAVNID